MIIPTQFARFSLLGLAMVLVTLPASSDPHVHGAAKMNLVYQQNSLHIEVISPMGNLVGFEHQPQTDKEKQQLAKTKQTLLDGNALFQTTPGKCHQNGQEHHFPFVDEEIHHHDEEYNMRQVHLDVELRYQFTCDLGSPISQVNVKMFETFPQLVHIEVQWITEQGQGRNELTADNPSIRFQ